MNDYVGLNDEEVKNSQQLYGLNVYNSQNSKIIANSLLTLIKEPIFIILLVLLIIYIFQKNYIFLIILSTLLIIILIIHFISILKLNKILYKINETQKDEVKVIRNGKISTINSNDVTINDILVLNKGDKVVADAIILESNNLQVYEAMLTKNNNFVSKSNTLVDKNQKYKNNYVYSESFIVSGNCFARVINIGKNTEYYKANKYIKSDSNSNIQKKIKKIVNLFYLLSLILFIIFTIIFSLKMGIISGIFYGFNIMISVIPYPLIFISMILYPFNIFNLLNSGMLIKNLNLVSIVNKISCLCIDKTGIVTEGEMKITNIKTDINRDELIKHALLASSLTPQDIIEKAIHEYSSYFGLEIKNEREIIKKYPFDKNIKMSANVYMENNEYYIYVKGSLESLFDICDISVEEKFNLFNCKNDMINKGLKVVAVGSSKINKIEDDIFNYRINFEGLIGIYDEPRANIQKYISYCQNNGIRVLMFTDDNKEISSYIGKTVGINNNKNVLNSDELHNKDKFLNNINDTNIFSQIKLEDKVKIIQYLQNNNEIVATTAYNVEDIFSLINSNIGISFNNSPDINKNIASITCLDNNFGTIVNNIKRVKDIYKVFKRMKKIILLVDISIIILSIILSFLNFSIPVFVIVFKLLILIICCVNFNKQ